MFVKLGIDGKADKIIDSLQLEIEELIELKVEESGNMTIFTFYNRGLEEDAFYEKLSELILDVILDNYVLDNLDSYINTFFKNMDLETKSLVYKISEKNILSTTMFNSEKELIKDSIIDYVKESPFIYLEGFILFRLKNLSTLIEEVVDKSIGELDYKKEYDDFLTVLKYIADHQSIDENIRLEFKNNSFILRDEDREEIDLEYFRNILEELGHKEISEGDLVVAALLALSPNRISIQMYDINNKEAEETIKLIEEIFENKIYYCYGCNNCLRKVGNSKYK